MFAAIDASWHGTACICTGELGLPALGGCQQTAAQVWFLAHCPNQNMPRSCLGKHYLEQAVFMPGKSLAVY